MEIGFHYGSNQRTFSVSKLLSDLSQCKLARPLLIETLMNNLNTYKGWVIDNLTAPAGGLKGIFYNYKAERKI